MTIWTSSAARRAGLVLAWLAAAGAATFAGSIAVGAIGDGILPQAEQPLSPDEVNAQLSQPITTRPLPTTTIPSSSPANGAPNEVFPTPGGTVVARCAPDIIVASATPAQGYRLKDVEPEDNGLRVRFESGHTRVQIQLACVSGRPVVTKSE